MRIAIVHYTAPPVIGGVERIVGDQAAALRMLGHEVDVLTRHDEAARSLEGISKYAAVLVHNVFTMPFDLEWTRQLREFAGATPGIRWFNWVHDVAAINPHYAHLPWHNVDHAPLKQAPPHCVHVAVSGVRRSEYMQVTGLPEESVHIIPNGIAVASVLGLNPRIGGLRLWEHRFVLFHPTRLIRRKNIELGIRVTAALGAAGMDAVYVVTGAVDPHQADGMRYFAELKELAAGLQAEERVLFLGEHEPVSDDDICSLYRVADALFLPSTNEGFGLPLLEASLHRLPIFCSDLPVHREVMIGRAHFFEIGQAPEKLAQDLIEWANTAPEIERRWAVCQQHDMLKICKEAVEPLLVTGNQIP